MSDARSNLPRNRDSMKWGVHAPDVLPLWVADLDLAPPDFVKEGLHRLIDGDDLGYTNIPPDFRKSVASWYQRRHHAHVTEEMVVALPGVVPGIYAFFLALGERGKNFLTHTPVYPYFLNGGRTAAMACVQVPLKCDDRLYAIDFDAMEKAATPDTRALLLCNPHNPSGRNFGLEELSRVLEFAKRRNLMVCSDEIWADWLLDGKPFIPFFELGDEAARRTVVLGAATKTFNIPGLTAAWAIIPNAELREKFRQTILGLLPSANYLGLRATTWVQEQGEAWFDSARRLVIENRRFAEGFIADRFPQVAVTRSEATYLMWLDFRETPFAKQPAGELLRRARVALSEGALFGAGGEGFARINLGTSRETLADALERIAKALHGA